MCVCVCVNSRKIHMGSFDFVCLLCLKGESSCKQNLNEWVSCVLCFVFRVLCCMCDGTSNTARVNVKRKLVLYSKYLLNAVVLFYLITSISERQMISLVLYVSYVACGINDFDSEANVCVSKNCRDTTGIDEIHDWVLLRWTTGIVRRAQLHRRVL